MESNLRILNAFKNLKESIEKEKEKTEINKKNIAIHDEEFEKVMKRVNDIIKQAQENKEELENEITDKIENIKIRVPKDGKDGKNGRDGVDGLDGQDGKDGRDGKDGKDGLNGKDGKDGKDGIDGIGILDAELNKEGELILKLTDGRKINVGRVTGKDGIGYRGLQGIGVTNAEIKEGHLIIILSDGTEIDAGHISGGGSGGTSDYEELDNLPLINSVELIGDKTLHDLGIQEEGDYALKSEIPTTLAELESDTTHRTVADTEKIIWNNKSDFSGNYNDLSNKPSIPSKTSDIDNDSGYITKDVNNLTNYTKTSDLSSVATSGNYEDLSNKPTIPVIPTNISAFTNDVGYVTSPNYYSVILNLDGTVNTYSSNLDYNTIKENLLNVSKQDYLDILWNTTRFIVKCVEITDTTNGDIKFITDIEYAGMARRMVFTLNQNNILTTTLITTGEIISNKTNDVVSNYNSEILYPTTKAVFDQFQRKPVVIWESNNPNEYLKAIQANLSASPTWQLTNLDMTLYKRIKIYSCAGQKTGSTASASTTPAIILEMSLDSRNAISAYGGNYVGSIMVQKPNDSNRFATLTCAVSADKTSFVVLRQTNLYGTAATGNDDVNANVFMIEGFFD